MHTLSIRILCPTFIFVNNIHSLVPQIHYWEKDKQNDTEKELVLFIPETSVHLKNLTSYTTYHIQLSAFNTAGDGPLSAARKGRTLQAGESHWGP